MKVSELIEILKEYPQDVDVYFPKTDSDGFMHGYEIPSPEFVSNLHVNGFRKPPEDIILL